MAHVVTIQFKVEEAASSKEATRMVVRGLPSDSQFVSMLCATTHLEPCNQRVGDHYHADADTLRGEGVSNGVL